jgi:hypothetical protein
MKYIRTRRNIPEIYEIFQKEMKYFKKYEEIIKKDE